MLLKTLLDDPNVLALFADELSATGIHPPSRFVETRAADYERVGAAFSYALRFGLAVRDLGHIRYLRAFAGLEITRAAPDLHGLRGDAVDLIEQAFGVLGRFSDTEELAPEWAEACFWLADLDRIAREGSGSLNRRVTGYELQELVDMYAIIPWTAFTYQHRIDLDPSFNMGSLLLGATTGMVLVDNILADVITSPNGQIDLRTRARMVVGALLANRYGVTGTPKGMAIDSLGLFFARSGVLRTVTLAQWIAPERAEMLLDDLLRRTA